MHFYTYRDLSGSFLAVPRSLLDGLGLAAKISAKSKQRDNTVFLHDYEDAPLFERTCELQNVPYTLEEIPVEGICRIRHFEAYKPKEQTTLEELLASGHVTEGPTASDSSSPPSSL